MGRINRTWHRLQKLYSPVGYHRTGYTSLSCIAPHLLLTTLLPTHLAPCDIQKSVALLIDNCRLIAG